MLEKLPTATLEATLDRLPLDLTFADETDTIRYYSKGDKAIFKRSPSIIGTKLQACHPQKSLAKLEQVLGDLKSGQANSIDHWSNHKGHRVLVRYMAVRDTASNYLGTLETIQDITAVQQLAAEGASSAIFRA